MLLATVRRYRWFIPVVFLVTFLSWGGQGQCLEETKKATWIDPLHKATLTVGKYTYEYNSVDLYEGTIKILQGKRVLFKDKVGGVGEVTWYDNAPYIEPFQMVSVNPSDPPVVLFYTEIRHHNLELKVYSTTEPRLLDVLDLGESGAEIKFSDGILEIHAENCFDLPPPQKHGLCPDAIFNISKGKFKLAKGGKHKAMFLETAEKGWVNFEKYYNRTTKIMKDEGLNWEEVRKKYADGSPGGVLAALVLWLANIENSGDPQMIKEALQKLENMSFLSEEEKKGLVNCLIKAGYDGLAIRK